MSWGSLMLIGLAGAAIVVAAVVWGVRHPSTAKKIADDAAAVEKKVGG